LTIPVFLELVEILDEARRPREELVKCLARLVVEGLRQNGDEDAVDRMEALDE
jgi:hypothetical protein